MHRRPDDLVGSAVSVAATMDQGFNPLLADELAYLGMASLPW